MHDTELNLILLNVTGEIVAAQVVSTPIPASEVPALVKSVGAALLGLGQGEPEEAKPVPVMKPAAALKKDSIACLCCGKKMKMLKRHLRTEHDMSPEEYREAFNLSPDYPMVAPNYADVRRDLAKKIGLGKKPGAKRKAKK